MALSVWKGSTQWSTHAQIFLEVDWMQKIGAGAKEGKRIPRAICAAG